MTAWRGLPEKSAPGSAYAVNVMSFRSVLKAVRREAKRDVDQKARTVGERLSDAIEDVIPGDSDHDGH